MSDDAEQVRTTLARIAHTADAAAELDDNLDLYTDDAVWEMGEVRLVGREELRAAAQARRDTGRAGPGTASRHVVATTAVTLDGDRAVAHSYWMFYVDTTTAPRLDSMGAYRDTLLRVGGRWRVAHREIMPG